MNNLQYMIEKNHILFEHIGQILVPDDQLVELPLLPSMVLSMKNYLTGGIKDFLLSATNCLYCVVYNTHNAPSCVKCPMALAGNKCSGISSTLHSCSNAIDKLDDDARLELEKALIDLAERYILHNMHLLLEQCDNTNG